MNLFSNPSKLHQKLNEKQNVESEELVRNFDMESNVRLLTCHRNLILLTKQRIKAIAKMNFEIPKNVPFLQQKSK